MRPQPPSARMRSVQAPIIPIVADLIRQCPGTISLGQGVVSYPPPPAAIAQIQAFLSQPSNHIYQPVEGIPALKQAIAEKLTTENGIDLTDRTIVVTAGSNMGFLNTVLAICDPGDEIILQTPYYFNHEMAAAIANCRTVCVPTDATYQLQPDLIAAAITPKTRAIVTISPNNPSGAVYSEAALRQVNQLCQQHQLYHISDETYEYFTYGVPHFSPAAIPTDRTISLFSLSKAYGFASWRIGYMVIPNPLREAVQKIQDTNLICPPVISQYAALGALMAGRAYCAEKIGPIAQVREQLLRALQSLGSRCQVPAADGAFYLLLKIQTDLDANVVMERLIREYGVAVIPGTAFGLDGVMDGCALRVGYGALPSDADPSLQKAEQGIQRLVNGLQAITQGR